MNGVDPELWEATLARFEAIRIEHPEERAQYRGSPAILTNVGGEGITTTMKLDRGDGTSSVYVVTVVRPNRMAIRVATERYHDSREAFWAMQSRERSNAIVVGVEHYRVGSGNKGGYGGRRFFIRSLETGVVTETHDLWYQGTIPPMFREQFPPTHEFVINQQGEK